MKDVEKAREIRLWLTQVVAPIGIVSAIVWNNCPNVRFWVSTKVNSAKEGVRNIFKKKE